MSELLGPVDQSSDLPPIEIVDMIRTKSSQTDFVQTLLVLNRLPVFRYTLTEPKGLLLAEDSGFYDCLAYEAPVGRQKAFAGRVFEVILKNGTRVTCNGQWWHTVYPRSYIPEVLRNDPLCSPGISTYDELAKCYVFCTATTHSSKIGTWLANPKNVPHTDYYALDKRRTPYAD